MCSQAEALHARGTATPPPPASDMANPAVAPEALIQWVRQEAPVWFKLELGRRLMKSHMSLPTTAEGVVMAERVVMEAALRNGDVAKFHRLAQAKLAEAAEHAEQWALRYPDAPQDAAKLMENMMADIRVINSLDVHVHYRDDEDDGPCCTAMLYPAGENPNRFLSAIMFRAKVVEGGSPLDVEGGLKIINKERQSTARTLEGQLNPCGWFKLNRWRQEVTTLKVDGMDVVRVALANLGEFGDDAQRRVAPYADAFMAGASHGVHVHAAQFDLHDGDSGVAVSSFLEEAMHAARTSGAGQGTGKGTGKGKKGKEGKEGKGRRGT